MKLKNKLCNICNLKEKYIVKTSKSKGRKLAYCRECNIALVKRRLKETKYAYDKSENRRIKARIRWSLRNKLKAEKIQRDPCFYCKSEKNLQFHHPNYLNEQIYISICKDCHLQEHNLIGYKLPIKEIQGGKPNGNVI